MSYEVTKIDVEQIENLGSVPSSGGTLESLSDVSIINKLTNDLIIYNSTSQKWENIQSNTITDGGNF